MKIFLSADLEGVAGVARDEQTNPASPLHAASRRLLTLEVNAAIEGALDAGVQEVVVSDGHWHCTNVLLEELHPRAELVSGHPRRLYMGHGIAPEGVVVKEGLGRQAARSLHPETARQRIRSGARRSIERLANIPVMRLVGGIDLEVDFVTTAMADSCERVPGVKRLGSRTVGYTSEDYVEVYMLMLALVDLAAMAV